MVCGVSLLVGTVPHVPVNPGVAKIIQYCCCTHWCCYSNLSQYTKLFVVTSDRGACNIFLPLCQSFLLGLCNQLESTQGSKNALFFPALAKRVSEWANGALPSSVHIFPQRASVQRSSAPSSLIFNRVDNRVSATTLCFSLSGVSGLYFFKKT